MSSRSPPGRRHSITMLVRPGYGSSSPTSMSYQALQHKQADGAGTPCDARPAGILVHGCHLQANGWEDIVWGHPPEKLGRLPQTVLLAWEERAAVVVLGTGASRAQDG